MRSGQVSTRFESRLGVRLREQGGVPMRLNLSDQEFHRLYCPVKNTKSALFLVAYFSVTTFVNWKGLHKAPERPDFVVLLFAMIVVAMLAKLLVAFTCFRERLVFALFTVSLLTGEVQGFVPSVFGQHAAVVKYGELVLLLLGLLVSLTMLVQSARSPNAGPSNRETSSSWQPQQNLPLWLVLILTVLELGAMLYFLPFRQ